MDFKNAAELLALCHSTGMKISEVMKQREVIEGEMSGEESIRRMHRALEIMKSSAKAPIQTPGKSMGGLIGGEAQKLDAYRESGKSFCGAVLDKAISRRTRLWV